jgi:hypothetical protein
MAMRPDVSSRPHRNLRGRGALCFVVGIGEVQGVAIMNVTAVLVIQRCCQLVRLSCRTDPCVFVSKVKPRLLKSEPSAHGPRLAHASGEFLVLVLLDSRL